MHIWGSAPRTMRDLEGFDVGLGGEENRETFDEAAGILERPWFLDPVSMTRSIAVSSGDSKTIN